MKNGKMQFCYEIGDAPCRACDVADMLDYIEDFPAADVRPAVHARWLDGYRKQLCPVCRYKGVRSWRFCPQCGAQMDADVREVNDER